jgi:secreted trypsin-like serine protease
MKTQLKISNLSSRSLLIAGLLATLTAPASAIVIRNDRTYAQHNSVFLTPGGGGYQRVFENVGFLSSPSGTCSGTAINSSWVLTAAHCLDARNVSAGGYRFSLGNFNFTGAAKFVHPSWTGNLSAGTDIALLRLSQAIPRNVLSVFPSLWTTNFGSEIGRTATVVGFGRTGFGTTGSNVSFGGIKFAAQNVIDAYGNGRDNRGMSLRTSNAILMTDFDNPVTTLTNRTGGGALPYEGLAAPGDSGGGLFIDNVLAGITSYRTAPYDGNPNSSYGDLTGSTRVASHIPWINNVLARRISNSETVPEPSVVLGLLAVGILGTASSRWHSRKSK